MTRTRSDLCAERAIVDKVPRTAPRLKHKAERGETKEPFMLTPGAPPPQAKGNRVLLPTAAADDDGSWRSSSSPMTLPRDPGSYKSEIYCTSYISGDRN